MTVGPSNWQKAFFVPTKSDANVVAFRKWLNKYSGGQLNWGDKFSQPLPPSPPKEQLMDRYHSYKKQIRNSKDWFNWTSLQRCLTFTEAMQMQFQIVVLAIKLSVLHQIIAKLACNIEPLRIESSVTILMFCQVSCSRYWSHVVNCQSCSVAHKGLKVLELVLQVVSIASLGFVAAIKDHLSNPARLGLVSMAILCYAASRWLSHFIYKNFHFHDYNHALIQWN